MLLGYARGKVGSLVFTRRKGEQVTRARNYHPANPRSPRQISQRMKIYAPVQFYKSSIATQFKFAFEDQRVNETPFNAFMRHNIVLSPWVSKSLANEYAPIPFPAVLSAGSAPSVNAVVGNFFYPGESQETQWGVAIDISAGGGIDYGQIGEVSTALMSVYPELREGDMLTFIAVRGGGLSIEDGDVLYNGINTFNFSYTQMIIDTTSNAGLDSVGLVSGRSSAGTEGTPNLLTFIGGDAPFDQEIFSQAGAIIVSRKDGEKIIASNSKLVLNSHALSIYNLMRTNAYRDKASLAYNVGTEALLDPNKQDA